MMALTARWKRVPSVCAAMVAVFVASACQTTPKTPPAGEAPLPIVEFIPLSAVAIIEQGQGQYPQLFSPDSSAVWVTPEVTALKRQEAAKEGTIEPWFDENARIIPSDYIVIECHVSSALGDEGVGYNAVAFRGFEVYLEVQTANGVVKARPAQTLIDTELKEGRQGAIRTFTRNNILVFPRQDFLTGAKTIPDDAAAAKLVLEGVQSRFTFTWPSAAGQPQRPPAEVAAQALKVGYRELYGRLSNLAHLFD